MSKSKTSFTETKRSIHNRYVKNSVTLIAIVWSLFQLVVAVNPISTNSLVAIHVAFGLAVGLMIYPIKKDEDETKVKRYLIIDTLLAISGIIPGIYLVLFQEKIMLSAGDVTTIEYILGLIDILLILELGRRVLGWAIISVALFAIAYAFWGNLIPGVYGHRGFSLERVINQLYLGMEGIYTFPILVSATFVYLFILFGIFLQSSGAGAFFIQLATSLLGRFRGGPAKVAIFSSFFTGMISGSAVANVVVTGSFTIPLMKKIGFKDYKAAAIEAAVSNGGQFMPPIMGAAAFIIPSMIGGDYWDVVKAAFIPGMIYFVAMFFVADLEAIKMGLKGLEKHELPSFKKTIKEGAHLLPPVIVLVYLLAVMRTSPQKAAFWSTLSLIALSMIKKSSRMSIGKILEILEKAAYGAIVVVSSCALGGIIVGVAMLTGIGMSLSGILIDVAQNSLILLLFFTMIASLILGMGMTTTACYIILAILVAPALVKSGVHPMAAHLFIFYFGTVSSLTPPVAVSAYAGAGVAGSNPTKTGFEAFKIGLPAFILPYMFVYGPSLLMMGSYKVILTSVFTSILGVYMLCAGTQGYFFGPLNRIKGVLCISFSLLMIYPGIVTDSLGLILIIALLVTQCMLSKNKKLHSSQCIITK